MIAGHTMRGGDRPNVIDTSILSRQEAAPPRPAEFTSVSPAPDPSLPRGRFGSVTLRKADA